MPTRVLVSEYAERPLPHRQAERYGPEEVKIERYTLDDQSGTSVIPAVSY